MALGQLLPSLFSFIGHAKAMRKMSDIIHLYYTEGNIYCGGKEKVNFQV